MIDVASGSRLRRTLRRWHVWLGWIVGVPFLLWSVSGLLMVARPIEEVRGEGLLHAAPGLPAGLVPVPPAIGPRPVSSLRLEAGAAGPIWIVTYADGASRRANAATGRILPPLGAGEAARAVEARYAGSSKVGGVDRVSADAPPIDLRRPLDAWRVTMRDGTRFYVHAATGEIVAKRTGWWQVYDFMWGLHIMDLSTREDAHNPLLIGFAVVSVLTTVLALILLPVTMRRRRKKDGRAAAGPV
jgi:hypothetical protein